MLLYVYVHIPYHHLCICIIYAPELNTFIFIWFSILRCRCSCWRCRSRCCCCCCYCSCYYLGIVFRIFFYFSVCSKQKENFHWFFFYFLYFLWYWWLWRVGNKFWKCLWILNIWWNLFSQNFRSSGKSIAIVIFWGWPGGSYIRIHTLLASPSPKIYCCPEVFLCPCWKYICTYITYRASKYITRLKGPWAGRFEIISLLLSSPIWILWRWIKSWSWKMPLSLFFSPRVTIFLLSYYEKKTQNHTWESFRILEKNNPDLWENKIVNLINNSS